jgi:zinc protease
VKIKSLVSALSIAVIGFSASAQTYKYESVPNDPTGTRIYTLANGLKVYLSDNKEEPRVQTFITVKTGSKNDPADVTGLAHYLEHMVFKGTSKFGTRDWVNEKVLLKEISDLYEKHKAEHDPEKKKAIYAEIDRVSGEAAKYAIANEYDKMISELGARGTNAFTSLEITAYINDIPATELEKWMKVESERFSELVLRLFHTELEAVYEEFNIGQDSDGRKVYAALNEMLYPTHPYGTQTTIGTGEHLKNPSMEKIHAYFDQYYVPNNMAISIAGDIDYDLTIKLIDQYFGKLKPGNPNPPMMPTEKPQTEIKSREIIGPDAEYVRIAWRTGGYHTPDGLLADLASSILSNGEAGLMDLNLLQKQAVLNAYAYSGTNHDYGMFGMGGEAKDGQSLEEVRDLLLAEVAKLKRGEFSDDLMKAIIKNNRKDRQSQLEYNWLRASEMSNAFVMNADWANYVNYNDRLEKITRQQVIDWANANLKDNYCIIYKRTGEDKDVYKVDKPQITPVDLNRTDKSDFYREYEAMESLRLKPQFLDYEKDLKRKDLMKDVTFFHIPNKTNDLFSLIIELDEDLREDKKVAYAMQYLDYLGTDKYTAEQLKQKFYSLGASYSIFSNYIMLSGLNESFDESLTLLQHLLANCRPDEEALKNLADDTRKERENAKLNKNLILQGGIRNYAMYGPKNRFNTILSMSEIEALKGEELCNIIRNLTTYRHSVLYYGQSDMNTAFNTVKKHHKLPKAVRAYNKKVVYPQLDITENTVYFVDYDMVQTLMLMLSKGENFNERVLPASSLFNSYFGSGLSSIVFQEIRESKALAYSANAYYSRPAKKDEAHYVNAFIGTQANKLPQAVDAMMELMTNMPRADIQFEGSKVAAMKQIETERVTKSSIYWNYRSAQRLGLARDIRKDIYDSLSKLTLDDLEAFFNHNIKDRNYAYCVIGKKSEVDMEALAKLGTIKELTLEELFGY